MTDKLFSFEKLTVYQKSLSFSYQIYTLTQKWPKEYIYGLTDQIRRASLSISLNIAEGTSRTRKDYRHFLTISRGSCYECIAILQLSLQLHLLSNDQYDTLYNKVLEISKMLSGLRTSLQNLLSTKP